MAYYIERQEPIDLLVICPTDDSYEAMSEYGKIVGIKEIQQGTFSINTRHNPKAKQQAMNIIAKLNKFEEAYKRHMNRVRSKDFVKALEAMIKHRRLKVWVCTKDQRTIYDSQPDDIDTFRLEYKGWQELKQDLDEHRAIINQTQEA